MGRSGWMTRPEGWAPGSHHRPSAQFPGTSIVPRERARIEITHPDPRRGGKGLSVHQPLNRVVAEYDRGNGGAGREQDTSQLDCCNFGARARFTRRAMIRWTAWNRIGHLAFPFSPTPTKRCSLQPDEFRQGKPLNPRGLVRLNKRPVSARGFVWQFLSRTPSRRKVRAWLRPSLYEVCVPKT